MGLVNGEYHLLSNNMEQSNYVNEWWTGGDDQSSHDCDAAQSFNLPTEGSVTGQNFKLELGGSVSGMVTDSVGEPIADLWVEVFSETCWGGWSKGMHTDENGQYSFIGLPAGNVYVRACASCDEYSFIDEWWDGGAGTTDCDNAEAMPVTSGVETENINFQLVLGSNISGTVYESDGITLVEGVEVIAVQSDPCDNQQHVGWAQTDSNGNYTIMRLHGGEYYLQTNNMEQLNYINEWWTGDVDPSNPDCNTAQSFTVPSEGSVTDRDFELELGGSVSGTVTDSVGEPIADLWVEVFSETCWGGWSKGMHTDENGEYSFIGLPAGDVYVRACAECNGQNYINEWWDDAAGTTNCEDAVAVPVTSGVETNNINFQLELGGSVSGMVSESGGTPIANIWVSVYSDTCWDGYLGGATTDENGIYSILGLAAGDVYVQACGDCNGHNYIGEWWDGAAGADDCDNAEAVPVTSGFETENIDFMLYTDSDGDGMGDEWEIFYFGDLVP